MAPKAGNAKAEGRQSALFPPDYAAAIERVVEREDSRALYAAIPSRPPGVAGRAKGHADGQVTAWAAHVLKHVLEQFEGKPPESWMKEMRGKGQSEEELAGLWNSVSCCLCSLRAATDDDLRKP